tara:strand:+ start:282 stop:1604 length:1323 start_codon:yes stop_codon:yes gene_type:complete
MFKRTLISFSLLSCFSAHALPVAPTEADRVLMQEVLGAEAAELTEKYALFFDSRNKKLIWFVPKIGKLASSGYGQNKSPIFNIMTKTPWSGSFLGIFFPKQKQVYAGGAFSSTGDTYALRKLYQTAAAAGYSVQPATAESSTLKFGLLGKDIDGDGYPDVNCISNEVTGVFDAQGKPLTHPECTYTIDGEVLGASKVIQVPDILAVSTGQRTGGRRLTNTVVPFNFNTVPSNVTVDLFQNSLKNTHGLDTLLYADINWELQTTGLTERARININWQPTFESVSTYAASHNYACIDVELTEISEKLLKEGAVTVKLYNRITRKWEPMSFDDTDANDDAEFIEAVNKVKEQIKNELFQEIKTKADKFAQSKSNMVTTEDDKKSVFFYRKNVEKRAFSHKEQKYVSWNPGKKTVRALTRFSLDCIEGGFDQKVQWQESGECKF